MDVLEMAETARANVFDCHKAHLMYILWAKDVFCQYLVVYMHAAQNLYHDILKDSACKHQDIWDMDLPCTGLSDIYNVNKWSGLP